MATEEAKVKGAGTRADPWALKTPPGSSEYLAFRDDALAPPALVVIVGKTELRYQLRCLDDLHAMLKNHGDWMPLGSADEQKPADDARWKRGRVPSPIRSAAGTASRRACAAALQTTCRRSWRHSGWRK